MVSTIYNGKLEYQYDIIDMKKIPCERFLNSHDPSAIALSILCDFEDRDKQLVVNTILKRLKLYSEDEMEFRNHLKMVEILSTNRDLEKNVQKGEEMLTVDIEKMPSFNIGLERGIQKGIFETAIRMINRFNLSIDEVIKELNIKKEELVEYMKKKETQEDS